jgi:Holliday junction resolvasome RuvABC endonuclease subunit
MNRPVIGSIVFNPTSPKPAPDAGSHDQNIGLVRDQERENMLKTIASLQARIDELMMEYCPNEMTTEQVRVWGESQRAVPSANEDQ